MNEGHIKKVKRGGVKIQDNWNPDKSRFAAEPEKIDFTDNEQALEHMRSKLVKELIYEKDPEKFHIKHKKALDKFAMLRAMSNNASAAERSLLYKRLGWMDDKKDDPHADGLKDRQDDVKIREAELDRLQKDCAGILDRVDDGYTELKQRLRTTTDLDTIQAKPYYELETSIDTVFKALEKEDKPKELLEKERKKIMELIWRYKNQKYQFYTPSVVMEDFINKLANPNNRNGLLTAANGTGKTTVAINILANIIWPGNNKWFKHDFFTKPDPTIPKSIRIVSRHITLSNEITPSILSWFPKGRYKAYKDGQKYISRIETDNGWFIDLLSYDMSLDKFESVTRGFIWCDEPITNMRLFEACITRMRLGGKIIVTAVPVDDNDSVLLYDIYDPKNRYEKRKDNKGKEIITDKKTFHVTADAHSACMTCDNNKRRGHLKHENIEFMDSSISLEGRDSRMLGGFKHQRNLVFKSFDPKVNVIYKPHKLSFEDHMVICSLDPHPKKEDAVIWMAIDRDDNYIVVDELKFASDYKTDATADLAAAIRDKERYWNMNVKYRVIDQASLVMDNHAKTSNLRDQLTDLGLYFTPGKKERRDSDQLINDFFQDHSADKENPRPAKLRIFKNCPKLLKQVERYHYFRKDEKQPWKIGKYDDDLIEALGRAVIHKFKWSALSATRSRTDQSMYKNNELAARQMSNAAQDYMKRIIS